MFPFFLKLFALILSFKCLVVFLYNFTGVENVESYSMKQRLLENTPSINTVFLGSSRINMGFNPMVFDKYSNLSSFNLGVFGFYMPHSTFYTENIIQSKRYKFIFQELSFPVTSHGVANFWDEHFFENISFVFSNRNSLSLSEGYLNKDFFKDSQVFLEYFFSPKYHLNRLKFSVFDRSVVFTKKGQQDPDWEVSKISSIHAQEKVMRFKETMQGSNTKNEIYFNEIQRLINLAKENNCHIIFVPPFPISEIEKDLLKGIFSQIPPENAIFTFSQPEFLEKLNNPKMFYDDGHLNEKGAIIYTSLIVSGFKETYKHIKTSSK
jgi:hypothetical protein